MRILIWVPHAGISLFHEQHYIPKTVFKSWIFLFSFRALLLCKDMNSLQISADYLWTFKTLSKPVSNYLVYHIQNRYNLIYVNTFPCHKAGSSSLPFSWNKAIHVGAGSQNAKPFTWCRVTELQILQEREEKGLGVWFEANSTTRSKREGSGKMHKLETLLFNFIACVIPTFIKFCP